MTKQLGSGYPIKVGIFDHETQKIIHHFLPAEAEPELRKQLSENRFVNIGDEAYFWSDIKYIKHIKGTDEMEEYISHLSPENRRIIRDYMYKHEKSGRGKAFKNFEDIRRHLVYHYDSLNQ